MARAHPGSSPFGNKIIHWLRTKFRGKVLLGKHLAEKEQARAEVVSPLLSSSEAHDTFGRGTCVLLSSVSA